MDVEGEVWVTKTDALVSSKKEKRKHKEKKKMMNKDWFLNVIWKMKTVVLDGVDLEQ